MRIPYIKGLNDIPNFLYSTTDVAIWSISEVGIGLGASAAATLRPLLRKVLGDSSITDGSATRKISKNWGGNNPTRSGYLEHGSENDHEQIISNGIPLEKQDPKKVTRVNTVAAGNSELNRSGSTVGLRDWESRGKGDGQSSDEEYNPVSMAQHGGIRKTVKITQS